MKQPLNEDKLISGTIEQRNVAATICLYLLTCTRSEQERNRLKEGEQPVVDEEGVDGGDGEGGQKNEPHRRCIFFVRKCSFDHGLR